MMKGNNHSKLLMKESTMKILVEVKIVKMLTRSHVSNTVTSVLRQSCVTLSYSCTCIILCTMG